MPDPTPFVGKFVDFVVEPGEEFPIKTGLNPIANFTAKTVNVRNTVDAGAGGVAWNFQFLGYLPGEVTICPLAGGVMSGPFSGCFVFRYRDHLATRVAHVGTADAPENPLSKRAKSVWAAVINRGAADVKGDSPALQFSFNEYQTASLTGLPIVCSYHEGANAWAIMFNRPKRPNSALYVPNRMKIEKVRPLPELDWSFLKMTPAWKVGREI